MLRGARRQAERRHDQLAWAAWHCGLVGRAKRPPPLSDWLIGQPARRRQTPMEMQAALQMWMAKG